jgi:hypothetical protein
MMMLLQSLLKGDPSNRKLEGNLPIGKQIESRTVPDAADELRRATRPSWTQTCAASTRYARARNVRNDHWQSATDPDSRIAKVKDGTMHLVYPAEHVVDSYPDPMLAARTLLVEHGEAEA